jgi:branched-chain amino acid transport system permease protein
MDWSGDLILQLLIIGLTNGMIIALIAIGYTMVYGIVELINFAHGDLFMLGSFAALTLLGALGIGADSGAGASAAGIAAMFIVVPAFCAGSNWLVERYGYRPLRHAPKLTVLVTAIGISFIFVNIGLFWGGLPMDVFNNGTQAAAPKDFPALIGNDNIFGSSAGVLMTGKDVLVFAVTVPLLLLLTWVVKKTSLGRSMRAVAQNPTAARLMGINVDRVIGWTFMIGGALAGVASVVYSLYINTISFQVGYRSGLDAFTAAVLGGIGNLPGAVLGAVLIGLIRAFCDYQLSAEWTNVLVFATLILLLVFRPSGLLGATTREKV